jgi:hypothetical protein
MNASRTSLQGALGATTDQHHLEETMIYGKTNSFISIHILLALDKKVHKKRLSVVLLLLRCLVFRTYMLNYLVPRIDDDDEWMGVHR